MLKQLLLIGLLLMPISIFAKREALIVAVGRYKNYDGVLHVEHDIRKMVKFLKKYDFHITILQDEKATYRNVVKMLKGYSKLSKNDVFVFYDTSHGVQIPDLNGDEEDRYDEALVLYDAIFHKNSIVGTRGLLIDDELEILLSQISAKKLMIIDACHSGSFYKGLNEGYTIKALNLAKNFQNMRSEFLSQRYEIKAKNLVTLSASKDNENSRDYKDIGGIFTDIIYKVWRENPNITFQELAEKLGEKIKSMDLTQQPQLNSTNNQENISVSLYLQDVEGYMDMVVEKSANHPISITSIKDSYRVKDYIYFDIDTYGKRGYLYILNVGEDKIELTFPNRYTKSNKISSTKFRFPSKFDIEATISNGDTQERTVAYGVLSSRPISELEGSSKISFETLKEIFGDPTQTNWWSSLFSSKISVGKSSFLVYR